MRSSFVYHKDEIAVDVIKKLNVYVHMFAVFSQTAILTSG